MRSDAPKELLPLQSPEAKNLDDSRKSEVSRFVLTRVEEVESVTGG